jgi:hypothetical protein
MGAVNIIANATLIGQIPASGSEVSFSQILYKYANLTLPYNPNDPGLSYTYNNTSLAQSVPLLARFFNLLNEPSLPVEFNVGTTTITVSVTGAGISGVQIFECLDVRLFGAKGDGKTDDTAAIQAALNRAHENYIAISLLSASSSGGIVVASGNIIGPTTVCIPSGLVCIVSPQFFDTGLIAQGAVVSGSSPWLDSIPPGWNGIVKNLEPLNSGYVCLSMDDGVTLLIDGTLQFVGTEVAAITAAVEAYPGTTVNIFLIENKNAFVGGPWPVQADAPVQNPNYDDFLLNYETGPRNTGIRVTGDGIIDCNGLPFWNQATLPPPGTNDQLVQVGAIRYNKCDDSVIDNVTIVNATENTGSVVEVGNSKNVTVQGITVERVMCDAGVFEAGASILFDVTRDSIIEDCVVRNFGNVGLQLFGSIRIQVLNNLFTNGIWGDNSAGTTGGIDIIAVYDWGFEATVFFGDQLKFNSLISNNKVIQNRGANWTPTTWYNVGNVVSPTRGYVSDQMMQTIGDDIFNDGHTSGVNEPPWPSTITSGVDDAGGYLIWTAIGSEQNLNLVIPVVVGGTLYVSCNGINLYGGDGNEMRMLGASVTNNVVTDNFGFGIKWKGLQNSLIAHNQVTRNQYGGIWEDDDVGLPSENVAIQDNDSSNNGTNAFSPPLNNLNLNANVTAIDQTEDNPQISPTSIVRGGTAQSFFNLVRNEVPTGTINGTNVTFTLANTPQAGTLDLYLNPAGTAPGYVLQADPSQYTISGPTITFVTAPPSGSLMKANYEW